MTLNNYLCGCMLINQGFLDVKCKPKHNPNLSLIQDWQKHKNARSEHDIY